MAAYLTKLDEYLRTPGHIDQTFTLIEEKAKIQRKYVGLGVAIIAMGLIFSTLAPLVVNLIAFLYPAYKSIKVIQHMCGHSAPGYFLQVKCCTSSTGLYQRYV